NLWPGIGAEVIPLVVPGPGRRQVRRRWMTVIFDRHRGGLLRRGVGETRPRGVAGGGPGLFGGRRAGAPPASGAPRRRPPPALPSAMYRCSASLPAWSSTSPLVDKKVTTAYRDRLPGVNAAGSSVASTA